jgi:cation:H+ antiporter
MLNLIIIFLLTLLSVFLIWRGSDWVTDSLIPIANKLGTGYIAITVLLVSFLISVPEIVSSLYSYFLGYLDIGIGVIVGSIMLNTGLTVGLSGLVKPLYLDKMTALRDGIFMIVVILVVIIFGSDFQYTKSEGLVLILLFIPYALNVWIFESMKTKQNKMAKVENLKENLYFIGHLPILKLKPSVTTFIIGSVLLVAGSFLFSFSLVGISRLLPIPGIVVGIVFGGIGAGLPNIVAALQGTLRGYKEVAITESIGSNIFTLLVTFGILIIMKPFNISSKVLSFDLSAMILINVLFISYIFKGYWRKEPSIMRAEGVMLILFYIIFVIANAFLS